MQPANHKRHRTIKTTSNFKPDDYRQASMLLRVAAMRARGPGKRFLALGLENGLENLTA